MEDGQKMKAWPPEWVRIFACKILGSLLVTVCFAANHWIISYGSDRTIFSGAIYDAFYNQNHGNKTTTLFPYRVACSFLRYHSPNTPIHFFHQCLLPINKWFLILFICH